MKIEDLEDTCVPQTIAFLLGLPVLTVWEEARYYFDKGIWLRDTRRILRHFNARFSKQKRHLVYKRNGERYTVSETIAKIRDYDDNKPYYIEVSGHCIGWRAGEIFDTWYEGSSDKKVLFVYEVLKNDPL